LKIEANLFNEIISDEKEIAMVRVKRNKEIVECYGVWASPKFKSFNALSGMASSAWGYGEEYPFIPSEKQFKDSEYIRLKLNIKAGWNMIYPILTLKATAIVGGKKRD
jgi:hypothetical protein